MTARIAPLVTQLEAGDGDLLAGDLGTIALKALLENGVGVLVSNFHARANPLDEAIAETEATLLTEHGVTLRRFRDGVAAAALLPKDDADGASTVRHAIVLDGTRGMDDDIVRIGTTRTRAATAVLCFDARAAEIDPVEAVVLDPEQHPRGIVRALDQAFEVSGAIGRPVFVLVRERGLAMRGVLRCRDNRDPRELAAPTSRDDVREALRAAQVDAAFGGGERTIVCSVHVFAEVQQALADIGDAHVARATAIHAVGAPGFGGIDLRASVERANDVLVLAPSPALLERWVAHVAAVHSEARTTGSVLAPDDVVAADVTGAVAGWVARCDDVDGAVRERAAQVAEDAYAPGVPAAVAERIPPRFARLDRPLPDRFDMALELAQAQIGIPSRVDTARASYRTDRGGVFTVCTAREFASHGLDIVSPAARPGSILLAASGVELAEVQARAAEIGATIELVADADLLELAAKIANCVAMPHPAMHVFVAVESVSPQVVTSMQPGIEPSLHASGRLVRAANDGSARGRARLAPGHYDVVAVAADAFSTTKHSLLQRAARNVLRVEL